MVIEKVNIKNADIKNTGLRGIKVADTKISYIDGTNGVLIYRGYRIEDLAKNSSYEETAYLILKGKLPTPIELSAFKDQLASYRDLPQYLIDSMKTWPKDTPPMQTLMASVAMLCFEDVSNGGDSFEDCEKKTLKLISRIPAIVAAWDRIRRGYDYITLDRNLGFAEGFLYQLFGKKKNNEVAKCLDVCLILHADHTFNASTFACRGVVSTKADIHSGILSGLAALSGPLHGGANEKVMEMLFSLKDEPDVEGLVRNRLKNGDKIMGMGHAVYKTDDPRAIILKNMGKRLGEMQDQQIWCNLLESVEKAAIEYFSTNGKHGIKPNVDFYSAPVYHLIGLSKDLFTPVFAIARVVGWCAHMLEEKYGLAYSKPALYRPSAEYIGKYCGSTGCEYKTINER